jgi:hypothetical protein
VPHRSSHAGGVEALAWRGRGLCAGMLENGVGRRLV